MLELKGRQRVTGINDARQVKAANIDRIGSRIVIDPRTGKSSSLVERAGFALVYR